MDGVDLLEQRLEELGTKEHYSALWNSGYSAAVLTLGLAINNKAQKNNLAIAFLGGLGVLPYVVDQLRALGNRTQRENPELIIPYSRPIHDVDIASDNYALRYLIKGFFDVESCRQSLSGIGERNGKYRLKVAMLNREKIGDDPSCVDVDYYCPANGDGRIYIGETFIDRGYFERLKKIPLFGVDLNVLSLPDLVKLKLSLGISPRFKDKQDLLEMLATLAVNKIPPQQAYEGLKGTIGEEGLTRLDNVLSVIDKEGEPKFRDLAGMRYFAGDQRSEFQEKVAIWIEKFRQQYWLGSGR